MFRGIELILEGRTQANALMRVVKEAGLSKDLGGSKPHLEVEAWQTIGRFNGYLTDIVWTRPIIEAGSKVGYEARAELVRIDDGVHHRLWSFKVKLQRVSYI